MSHHKKRRSPSKGMGKIFASKRTANPPRPRGRDSLNTTAAPQHHDAQRRLGSFEGRGEHARTGNRGRR